MDNRPAHLDLPPAAAAALRWLRRLSLATLLLLLALLALELAARHFLPNRSSRLLIDGLSNGQPAWVDNPFFAYRFFPPRLAPSSPPIAALKTPPPESLRVCLLGGSEAMGAPDPAFGLARQLELMLQARYPSHLVEVLPMTLDGGNALVLREAARDLERLHPHAIIVLTGNDEFSGPFGPAAHPSPLSSPRLARLLTLASRSHLSPAARAALQHLFPARDDLNAGRQQEPVTLQGRIPPLDPRLDSTRRAFRDNYSALLRLASRSSPLVLACTVPVNLRDCAPFSTSFLPDETSAQQVREILRAAAAAESSSNLPVASRLLHDALRLDPTHADALFRAARIALLLDPPQAPALFSRARDADALRLRADSSLNALIRQCASATTSSLFDAEALFADRAPHHIPGREFFLDHIHFTFEATHLLASSLLDRLEALHAFDPEPSGPLPDAPALAALTLFDPWGHAAQLDAAIALQLHNPFRRRLDNPQTLASLNAQKQLLAPRLAAMAPPQSREILARHLANRPHDPALAFQAARLLLDARDFPQAETAARSALAHWPHRFDVRALLALLRIQQGTPPLDALALLPGSNPDSGYFDISLSIDIGRALLADKHPFLARPCLEHALQRDPWNSDAAIALAEAAHQIEGAAHTLRHALRSIPRDPEPLLPYAIATLEQAVLQIEESPQSVDILQQAIRRNPRNPFLWMELASLYCLQGDWEIATECFEKSEELAPHRYERLLKWADALVRLRQYGRAYDPIRRYLAAFPDDPEGLALLAQIQTNRPSKFLPPPEPKEKPSGKFPWE